MFFLWFCACRGANSELPRAKETRLPISQDRVTIPSGTYAVGCDRTTDKSCGNDEPPLHVVHIEQFSIDRTEVTVAAYRQCVEANVCTPAVSGGECNYGEEGRDRFPINCVTWEQAKTFCEWANGRLPTEVEWEVAARGSNGRKYPWGNEPPDANGVYRANYGEGLVPELWARDRWIYDAPVGTFTSGASPFGLYDMAGNVAEWVADRYSDEDDQRVVKGGSWRDYAKRIRCSARDMHPPTNWYSHVGFRCAGQ